MDLTHSMLTKDLEPNDPLRTILLNAADLTPRTGVSPNSGIYWNADHYKLSNTTAYKNLTAAKQEDILRNLSHWSLSLSYYIEKFGLNYGAKMIATADTTEEKSLYGLFTGDEVRHRLWLEQFICSEIPQKLDFHPLLPTLALCLEQGTKEAMVFTIQVILEGFGISHYASLGETCQSPELTKVFTDILKDEAHHHGMGIVLSQRIKMDSVSKEQIETLMIQIIRALMNAEWVYKAIEMYGDGLTTAQKNQFKEETQWNQQIQQRILRIKALIKKVGYEGLLDSLDRQGAFKI